MNKLCPNSIQCIAANVKTILTAVNVREICICLLSRCPQFMFQSQTLCTTALAVCAWLLPIEPHQARTTQHAFGLCPKRSHALILTPVQAWAVTSHCTRASSPRHTRKAQCTWAQSYMHIITTKVAANRFACDPWTASGMETSEAGTCLHSVNNMHTMGMYLPYRLLN